MGEHRDTLSLRLWDTDEGLKMVEMEESEDGPKGGSQSRGWQQNQSAAAPRAQTHKRTPVDECGVRGAVSWGRIFSSTDTNTYCPGGVSDNTGYSKLHAALRVCACACVHVCKSCTVTNAR